jgi:MFS transporter, PAT family, beta-lactamase induction signal transducer AmpG
MTINTTAEAAPARRDPHPALFLILMSPFGIATGYTTTTLGFQLGHNGVPAGMVAAMVAATLGPQVIKVLWAPIVDITLTSKWWYIIGAAAEGLAILVCSTSAATQAALPFLTLMVVIASFASTFTSMAGETMMASLHDDLKGAASGWGQAGNFAGLGVGGGLGLFLVNHVSQSWVSGAALFALCMACALGLFFVGEPERLHTRPNILLTLVQVLQDVWSMLKSRLGLLCGLIMLLPIGTSAASNLWAAIAGDWKANADVVSLSQGAVAGVLTAVGCLVGGYACDRLDRKTAYCLFGLVVCISLVAMALSPRTPSMFIVFTLSYAVITGACYAAYSAVVLEAIGRGAAATKFNLMASIANVPVLLMTQGDGWFHDRGGASLMLYGEAACGVLAVLFFAGIVALWPKRAAAAP